MRTIDRRHFVQGAAALAGQLAFPAFAAGYPERDITFVNPWSAGGSVGVMSRQYAQQLEKLLNGNVIVESRPGGSGTIGVGTVVRAKPDGYTIGYAGNSTLAYQPLVLSGLAWAKPEDYQPIVKLNYMPTVLAVRADSPIKTWDDFLKDAKSRPGQVRVGVAGLRTPSELELQVLNRAANLKVRPAPFTGGVGECIIALLGGRIEAVASYTDGLKGHAEAGVVRVIAVFQKGRYDAFPEALPIGDHGFAEVWIPSQNYVIGPKGMPQDILDKLLGASMAVVKSDEFKTYAQRSGLVLDPLGPDGIRAELVKLTQLYTALLKTLDTKAV